MLYILSNAILDGAIGLDPYAAELLAIAKNYANNEEYFKAVQYLQSVPKNTKFYSASLDLTQEYNKLQKELNANKLLTKAENSARYGNYERALDLLKKIPSDTQAYSMVIQKTQQYNASYEKKKLQEIAYSVANMRDINRAEVIPQFSGNNNLHVFFKATDFLTFNSIADRIIKVAEKIQFDSIVNGDIIFFVDGDLIDKLGNQSVGLIGKFFYNSSDLKTASANRNLYFSNVFGLAKKIELSYAGKQGAIEYCLKKSKDDLGLLCNLDTISVR